MYTEGYLGAAKMLVETLSVKTNAFKKAKVVLLDQSVRVPTTIRCYATSVELRHAAAMLVQAADQLDK